MIKNCNESIKINHSPNWPYIPDNPFRILIISVSRLGKTNVLLNLVNHQQLDVEKIYLYFKDPFQWKYQLLINGKAKVGIKQTKNPEPFIN